MIEQWRALWKRPKKETYTGPMKGVKLAGLKIDRPKADASGEQWLDFGTVMAACYCHATPVEWQERVARAYLKKWGGPA